jgi:hypothetical protein
MHLVRRSCAAVSAAFLATGLLATLPSATSAASDSRWEGHGGSHHTSESAQVVLDWERISFRTIYTDGATPIPVGVPVLGFTSLAMNDAARSARHGASATAAVAKAAHDVLLAYYPTAAAKLDADLTATLLPVPDGWKESAGLRAGERAAARMIASRVGDGYLDGTIHYTLPAGIGVWEPLPPNTDMLAAWLGSMRTVVLKHPVRGGRPDPVTSKAYAADFDEVSRFGGMVSERTQAQTDTSNFFNSNAATMVSDALVRYLESSQRLGLKSAARLFAAIHGSMTDAVVRCWQLKRDVGFWRPTAAIAAADVDGNPDTSTVPGWTSLLQPVPNYSDYVSGHGCLTSSAVEVIRRTLGEHTPLELISVNTPDHRTYASLSELEANAFMSRIWGGLHFRKAMEGAYSIGHRTARAVMGSLRDDRRHR